MITKHAKIEYVWLDGYKPEPTLRSKTKVITLENPTQPIRFEDIPDWSFDGSSTQQAEGGSSDCILRPVKAYNDVFRSGRSLIVLCEVLNADHTPHESNHRADLGDGVESESIWFGYEQEYTLIAENGRPLGFPDAGYPEDQGPYYCAVGHGNVTGRRVVETHMDMCLAAGIELTGVNAEVMLGQWEFQVLGKGAKSAADDLWMARYLLHKVTEEMNLRVEFHPKPVKGDWNGSGLHTNFSNNAMRTIGGEKLFTQICEAMGERHNEAIRVYGSDNEQRLTGNHETQHIDEFSYGLSDRGASIRIPIVVPENDWKGYLEDRRPASNANPYDIAKEIVSVLNRVNVPIYINGA